MGGHYVDIVLCILLFRLSAREAEAQKQPLVSALYIFGDSTMDSGNNNGLATVLKANFLPYGRDFFNGRPTGRFTNGRLVTDILSELMGLPDSVPASLDPAFQGEKLLTGASFASGGSGYAYITSQTSNVIPLEKQVENFRQYRGQLADYIGQENGHKIVSEALFVISMGTNDFAITYYTNPSTRKIYSIAQFQDILIQFLTEFIQNVYSEGGTRLAIIGLPPFGCLPSQITLHNLVGNTCVDEFNEVATSFNMKIKALVQKMELIFHGFQIVYLDAYENLIELVKFPKKYGFEVTRKGCCGTGLLEAATFCNQKSQSCRDASKYVFWDSIHPTSTVYNITANDLFRQLQAAHIIPIPRN